MNKISPEQVSAKRRELEEAIAEQISAFVVETGVQVQEICIETHSTGWADGHTEQIRMVRVEAPMVKAYGSATAAGV